MSREYLHGGVVSFNYELVMIARMCTASHLSAHAENNEVIPAPGPGPLGKMACSVPAEDEPPPDRVPSTVDEQPRSMEKDFIFVERPSEDFFCPVSLELLLEPQLTSCCGHHLSQEL